MAVKSPARRSTQDSYFELLTRFPLRPIRTEDDHEAAAEIIGELIGRKMDRGTSDYFETLAMLVNKYEDEHHSSSNWKSKSPQEFLRALMRTARLTQADIGRIVGSESAVSMFFSGKRGLSKSHIKALAARFGVDASAFM